MKQPELSPLDPPLSYKRRLFASAGLALSYLASYPVIHELVGEASFALSVLPAGLVGWCFGARAGLTAGFGALAVNAVFLSDQPDWDRVQFGVISALVIGMSSLLGMARDSNERWRAEILRRQTGKAMEDALLLDKMNILSSTDELTGLYNRRRFNQVIESEVPRSIRDGASFSLLLLDLDSFKSHNDRYGHPSGDAVLKAFATVLQSSSRKTDTAFRIGGDEFGIILPDSAKDVAGKLAERLSEAWQNVRLPGAPMGESVGFSVGIAEFPGDATEAGALFAAADAMLYRAKLAARAVVHY
ncbi:MAG: GGDEF domain-containing protein [Chloroflexi bacterium]|nr:GGDEF domain-containing protein [Chloroflexota bacterium]